MQRLRIRYAKRGRLRFLSHRDVARAFERAIRRARLPIGFSAGFSPHPKISWVGATPTGVASEAEYVEIGLSAHRDPDEVRAELDAALPPDLDVLECVEAAGGSLPDRVEASLWRFEFPGLDNGGLAPYAERLVAAPVATVNRMTKNGLRDIDVRASLVSLRVPGHAAAPVGGVPCAILEAVVRLATPVVRPDDVLTALRDVASLTLPQPPRALRLAQGLLDDDGRLVDPLEPDRAAALAASEAGAGPAQRDDAVDAPPA